MAAHQVRHSLRKHRQGPPKPNQLLVVEDSRLVQQVIAHIVEGELKDFTVHFAASFSEGKDLYQRHKKRLVAGLIDLTLPDAKDGDMVDYLLRQGLPVVVLTGNFSDEKRTTLLRQGIVDYVVKESAYSYQYAIGLINRLAKNRRIKVLVAEDSASQRAFIANLLREHLFDVITAENGKRALQLIEQHSDIKLLITDCFMPEMNGVELTRTLRRNHNKANLIIIGLSGGQDNTLSARFIKNGANDFLHKPFIQEEFHCRISHNIEALEHLEIIQEAAYRDPLTNLFNRRYLFEHGQLMHNDARLQNLSFSVALIDIDHFKKINDNHGHKAGDDVLTELGKVLTEELKPFLIARLGGEEFCILLSGISSEQANQQIETLRQAIMERVIIVGTKEIQVTVSAGVSDGIFEHLDEQINEADTLLYKAKQQGRNRVVCRHP